MKAATIRPWELDLYPGIPVCTQGLFCITALYLNSKQTSRLKSCVTLSGRWVRPTIIYF